MSEWDRFAETVLGTIKGVRDSLTLRIDVLEKSQPLRGEPGEKGDKGDPGLIGPIGPQGERGESADVSVIQELRAEIKALRSELLQVKSLPDTSALEAMVSARVAQIPVPRDGRDVDPLLMQAAIDGAVTKAVSAAVQAIPVPANGRDGKDIDPAVIDAMVRGALTHAMKSIPVPRDGMDGKEGPQGIAGKDGASVTVQDVVPAIEANVIQALAVKMAPQILAQVTQAVEAIPKPKDGTSITADDVVPMIKYQIDQIVSRIPAPKDGLGVKSLHIDTNGYLIQTWSDGRTEPIGLVKGEAGRDGLPGVPGRWGEKGADGRDGKDGKDGLGVADFSVVFEPEKGWIARWTGVDRIEEKSLGTPFDAGVWKAGRYPAGACVTRRGGYFVALRETSAPPDENTAESRDWRLAVKSGRDGKNGKDGRDGMGI